MVEIKLICKGAPLQDITFYDVEAAVEHLVIPPVVSLFFDIEDYILIVNGRRYDWPPVGNFHIREHIQHCIDMDEAFYG